MTKKFGGVVQRLRRRERPRKEVPREVKRRQIYPLLKIAPELSAAVLGIASSIAELNGVQWAAPGVAVSLGTIALKKTPGIYANKVGQNLRIKKNGRRTFHPIRPGPLKADPTGADFVIGVIGDDGGIAISAILEEIATDIASKDIGCPVTVKVINNTAATGSAPSELFEHTAALRTSVREYSPNQKVDAMVAFTGFKNVLDGTPYEPNDYRRAVGLMTMPKQDVIFRKDMPVIVVTPFDISASPHIGFVDGLVHRSRGKRYGRDAEQDMCEDIKEDPQASSNHITVVNLSADEALTQKLKNVEFDPKIRYLPGPEGRRLICQPIGDALRPGLVKSLEARIQAEGARKTPEGIDWGRTQTAKSLVETGLAEVLQGTRKLRNAGRVLLGPRASTSKGSRPAPTSTRPTPQPAAIGATTQLDGHRPTARVGHSRLGVLRPRVSNHSTTDSLDRR